MMVDASALVAVLLREPEAPYLVQAIADAKAPFTSPIALFETIAALMRVKNWSADRAEAAVRELLTTASIDVRAIPDTMASLAASAFDRFGKGRHPAALNLGDCFAYAIARASDAPLLYKGGDFAKTDIRSAIRVR